MRFALPRVVVAGVVVLVSAVVLTVLMAAVLHGRVTSERLASSVGRDVPGVGSCRREAASRTWSCGFRLDSDGKEYEVRVHPGSSCWDARAIGGGFTRDDTWPAHATGCVRRWQW